MKGGHAQQHTAGRTIGVAAYNTGPGLAWGTTGAVCGPRGSTSTCANGAPIPVTISSSSRCRWAASGRLRPRHRTHRGDPPEPVDYRAVHEKHAGGPFKADHPLTTPPPKERTLQDIETLITHFLQVSGPGHAGRRVLPDDRGDQGDQQLLPDQRRIHHELPDADPHPEFRPPAADPSVIRGQMVSDLIVYLGSIDFVMSDVDRPLAPAAGAKA